MKAKNHLTGFYAEALLLVAAFVGVVLLLTNVFAAAEEKSLEASRLTDGVLLAENTAEAFSSAGTAEDLLGILNENDNASLSGNTVTAEYGSDLSPDPDGIYSVTAELTESGSLTDAVITVTANGNEIYSLTTSVYAEKEAAE